MTKYYHYHLYLHCYFQELCVCVCVTYSRDIIYSRNVIRHTDRDCDITHK